MLAKIDNYLFNSPKWAILLCAVVFIVVLTISNYI